MNEYNEKKNFVERTIVGFLVKSQFTMIVMPQVMSTR